MPSKNLINPTEIQSKRLISVDFIVNILFMKNFMYKMKLLTEYLESIELNTTDALIL
jgi:hypothetical protein